MMKGTMENVVRDQKKRGKKSSEVLRERRQRLKLGKSDKNERIGERKKAKGGKNISSPVKAKECLIANKRACPLFCLLIGEL